MDNRIIYPFGKRQPVLQPGGGMDFAVRRDEHSLNTLCGAEGQPLIKPHDKQRGGHGVRAGGYGVDHGHGTQIVLYRVAGLGVKDVVIAHAVLLDSSRAVTFMI